MSVTESNVLTPANHLELVASQVALKAAVFVRTYLGQARIAATKSTATDIVTETDIASEALIRRELESRCPGSSILGEELGQTSGDKNQQQKVGWIVDPIDGTVNFHYGLPVVSVSIAATINDHVVAGAVSDVLNGTTFSASLGGGARCDGESITASSATELATSLIGTGFAYDAHTRHEQAQTMVTLLPACRDIRCMGSAALNLCWVGAGLLDGYTERGTKIYDYAAGALIASEAGAVVRTPEDTASDLTVAAGPGIIDEFASYVVPDNSAR